MRKTQFAIAIPLALLASQSIQAQNVDLASFTNGFRIDGANAGDFSGFSVSGAGDVNGDGLADLIVGARLADPGGDSAAGSSYVIFGKADTSTVDLDNLASNGFRVDGVNAGDFSGFSVSGAGDVNGDGLADLIVGASSADPGGDSYAGSSYVIFGKADTSTVDLDNLASNGFRIDGANLDDRSGSSVSGAGDVNGDGLADLIVGAFNADTDVSDAGSSYVVFGKANTSTVDVAGSFNGFRIDGANAGEFSGASVSGAGDVNGDGLADLIVGAFRARPGGNLDAGSSYLIFGKASTSTVDLDNLSSNGFRINGANPGDFSGRSVSGAGDVNGDGLADLIVGASNATASGDDFAGSSYVVFGKSDSDIVDLDNVANHGFLIEGANEDDRSGSSVSGAGDVNGDGLADLIVGAFAADTDVSDAGSSYVVFGKTGAGIVNLANLVTGGLGYRIDGSNAGDSSEISVSGAGDVNGDGLADLIVGAPRTDPNGSENAGSSYVVFSEQIPSTSTTYIGRIGSGNAPRLPIGTSGDGSNASHPDSRVWVNFADGSGFNGRSTMTVTRALSNGSFTSAAANVSWQLTSRARFNWTTVEVTFRYLDSELTIADESLLEVVHSIDGNAPFTPLTSVVNPLDNTVSVNVPAPVETSPGFTELGFYYFGEFEVDIFSDGFE